MKYINTENVVIKSWCNNPEEGAIEQAKNLANLPFIFRHVALMPDTHQGYGMPIGGVIATKNIIIPNAVGVDIGCGMLAVKTSLTEISQDRVKEIMTLIRQRIPVGFNRHSKKQDETLMPEKKFSDDDDSFDGFTFSQYPIVYQEYDSALKQLGTLGGGNHFIEIQKGSDGHIWFMVHSGSRNFGYKIAKHYNNLAKELNQKWHTSIPQKHDLAFLPIDTEEGHDYIREMNYALDFAQANRNLMAARIRQCFIDTPCPVCNGRGGYNKKKCPACDGDGLSLLKRNVEFEKPINIHHNYAAIENHFGQNVWVHRKGATSAREGQLGLIPGSQGTKSYVVKGKGNPESFMSCSHGAGRKMSRTKAQENLDLETEKKKLDDQGIVHSIRHKKDLDEASSAYKDINIVMEEQTDLVDIIVELTPLGVIKG